MNIEKLRFFLVLMDLNRAIGHIHDQLSFKPTLKNIKFAKIWLSSEF